MKSIVKKAVIILCATVMMASMTACGFDVSTSYNLAGKNDQPAAEYNAEYLAEKFELEDAVAEVIANKLDEKGFGKIKTNKKKIVNGTGSFTFGDGKKKYTINVEDGYISTLTDSDGMVIMTLDDILEAANGPSTDSFETVLTSDPVTPSTDTDVTNEPADVIAPTESGDGDVTTDTTAPSGGDSYVSEEAQKALATLESDYSKINWGVQYTPTGLDGIVISVAPYTDGKYTHLLVGVTNLYNQDITFSASGFAKGKSGQEIGKISFYELAVRPGSTVVRSLYCDDIPTGEIHWDSIELPTCYDTSVYWEGDWAIQTDKDGFLEVPYQIVSSESMEAGTVTAVVLDSKGNILAVADDYNVNKGTTAEGTIQFFINELPGTPVDLALFANPLAE